MSILPIDNLGTATNKIEQMKIVTWNCNGALRKKLDIVNTLGADILVVQECEDPSLSTNAYKDWAGEYLWVGTSKNKGIGVFPKNGHTVKQLNWNKTFSIGALRSTSASLSWSTSDLKLFLPFTIDDTYTALGVWTKGSDAEAFGYMGQFWKYLQLHHEDLSNANTIILGDFNSNAQWDKQDRWWSHTDVINELEQMGIKSLYHTQCNEAQGQESTPTFYHQRKLAKPYHIDYVFMSKTLIDKSSINTGSVDTWLEVSDHLPLTVKTK